MSEHFLDRTQIGPTAEQVGRKRVPEQMRFYVLRDARAAGVFFNDVPQGNPRERAATVAQKQLAARARLHEMRTTRAEI